ncbi:MAG: hypothetical protein AB1813_24025 [Verrucomicrobiota bacterium]|jgi:ABC-type transporter Mla MlaB component
MLKVSVVETNHSAATLRVEGRLVGAWVKELFQACERELIHGRRLKLDLAQLEFADLNGIALMRSLQARQVELLECSPLLIEQMKSRPSGFIEARAEKRGC